MAVIRYLLLLLFLCSVATAEMTNVAKESNSDPHKGVVFAVCVFTHGEDGSRTLVAHKEATDLVDCLKKKRLTEREFKDPKTRNLYTYSSETVFTMTCDKVDAEVEIQDDGSWKILNILGRHDAAYTKD